MKEAFPHRAYSLLIACGLILSLFSYPAKVAWASNSAQAYSPDEPNCWPLDIVLLMDQSQSIFQNDPSEYRATAARRILTLLISNRRAQCPEIVHRFGLVTYGHRAETQLDLVPIDIEQDADRQDWLEERGYLAAVEAAIADRTQRATNFQVAFGKAEELFAEAPAIEDPIQYGTRRQVVVLLTDGEPAGVGDARDHMCELSERLYGPVWDATSIWVLALRDRGGPYLSQPGCEGTIREDWDAITRAHRGRFLYLEYNEQMIPAYMKDIIDAEFGQPGIPLSCGVFHVDPYLKQVQFTFQKNLEDERRSVILEKLDSQGEQLYRYRDGKALAPDTTSGMTFRDDLYYNRDLAEVYTFDYPLAGAWRFEVEGLTDEECEARVEARENREEIRVELSQPEDIIDIVSEPPYYDQETPELQVHIWNTDRQAPFESDEAYPVEAIATLSLPSGSTTLPDGSALPSFELSESEPGIWVSSDPMVAPEVGKHTLTVVGRSKDGEGNFGYGVFTDTVTYEVLKRERLSFEITSPAAGAKLRCNTVEDGRRVPLLIPVSVQLLEGDGRPAPGGEYLDSDLNQSFYATLSDVNNVELDMIVLSAGSEEPGVFEGALLADRSEVEGCGQLILSVDFAGEYDERRFTMPMTRGTTSFERQAVQGVQVEVDPANPEERLLLHPNLWAARPGGYVNRVPLEFRLTNLDNERLDPSAVAVANPEDLYTVELSGPTHELHEVVTPTVEQLADGAMLVASGGLTMTQPGDYHFAITAQREAFRAGYMPAYEDTVAVPFKRYDTPMTHPTTALVAIIVAGILLIVAIVLVIRGLTGGPGGTIQLFDHETGLQINERPWRASRARFLANVIGIRNRTLKSYRIKVIKAKKTQPLEEGRAALITMISTDDEEVLLYDEHLESGEKREVILPGDLDSVDIQYI